MSTMKRKTTRRELILGLIITLLGSPIIGSAILFATIGIILSILVLTLTGEEIFFGAIAVYSAMLVVLYLLLWRILRRSRVLIDHWRATRKENQRTAHLQQTSIQSEAHFSDRTVAGQAISYTEEYSAEALAAKQ